jgi:hypothetical protein
MTPFGMDPYNPHFIVGETESQKLIHGKCRLGTRQPEAQFTFNLPGLHPSWVHPAYCLGY